MTCHKYPSFRGAQMKRGGISLLEDADNTGDRNSMGIMCYYSFCTNTVQNEARFNPSLESLDHAESLLGSGLWGRNSIIVI